MDALKHVQDEPAEGRALPPEAAGADGVESPPLNCFAPADVAANRASGWPWARIARPAVVSVAAGKSTVMLDASPVAAIDYAIAAARGALASALGLPVAMSLLPGDAAKDAAPAGYGAALTAGAIESLVMFDPQAVRLLANAQLLAEGGAPSPVAPGPVADAGDVDRALIEYITLLVIDRVLRTAPTIAQPPVIRAFCDAGGAGAWLAKHKAKCFTFSLALGGSAGAVRVYLSGLSDEQAAGFACLSLIDSAGPLPQMIKVSLALPAVTLTAQEMASMAAGDVLLLGAPSLAQLTSPCELVTETHWSLGTARIVHDTPTYLSVMLSPGRPAPRAAALAPAEQNVLQPVIGEATMSIDQLASATGSDAWPLAKEPLAPVRLLRGTSELFRGELVVLGSELGVRLLDVIASQ